MATNLFVDYVIYTRQQVNEILAVLEEKERLEKRLIFLRDRFNLIRPKANCREAMVLDCTQQEYDRIAVVNNRAEVKMIKLEGGFAPEGRGRMFGRIELPDGEKIAVVGNTEEQFLAGFLEGKATFGELFAHYSSAHEVCSQCRCRGGFLRMVSGKLICYYCFAGRYGEETHVMQEAYGTQKPRANKILLWFREMPLLYARHPKNAASYLSAENLPLDIFKTIWFMVFPRENKTSPWE